MRNLFKRKKRTVNGNDPTLKILRESEAFQRFFSDFIKELLIFLKDFSLDAKELNTRKFRDVLEVLARKVKTEKKIKDVRTFFEKNREMMHVFIRKQNLYLLAKESEFKEMIDLLTQAMAKVSVDNDDFSQKILEQNSRIEQATSLSDIKELKGVLKKVVEEVREKVREKQARDDKRIAMLGRKVQTLSEELEKAEKGNLRDDLTGIYNMNAFKKYIKEAVGRSAVEHAPFSLVALDIDEFNKILQNYGPKLGDRIILAIAEKCREFQKPGDFAARYEGGVFVMVLPDESLKKAVKRAKQFCKAIAKSKYTLDDIRSEHVLSFTISMGVTRFITGDTVEAVIRRALMALNYAKSAGGNRVVSKKR